MDTVSWELVREMTSGDFFFLCRAFWMEAGSEGRLANWWNTLRLRMMAYTRLQFPGGRVEGCLSVFKTIMLHHVVFLTIKLVLDYIIESLEKEEDKVMVLGGREEEPAGGEGLQQVEQFVGSHHGEALQVRRHCKTENTSRRVLHNEMISASVAVFRLGRQMALQ